MRPLLFPAGACWLALAGVASASAGEIRVGIASGRVIAVDCDGGEIALGAGKPRACGAKETVLAWPGGQGDLYRVQVAAFRDDSEAIALAARLGQWGPIDVDRDPANGLTRVRTAAHRTRDSAMAARAAIAAAGLGKGFLVGERGAWLRVARTGLGEVDQVSGSLVVRPAAGKTLEVDGARYRGAIEILGSADQVTAVNVLELEEYLRGVVPKEMGPYVYPEVEALKAQTIAARSWAVANLGRHRGDGFDVCDGAHCQVYGGADAVHELSDRAVAETTGLVLSADGRVVESFFSATCGGHTEDVEKVFLGSEPSPWLRGVACSPPGDAIAIPPGVHLPTFAPGPAALLVSAGILHDVPSLEQVVLVPSRGEAQALLSAASLARGGGARNQSVPSAEASLTSPYLATLVVREFGLEERGEVLLDAADLAYLARGCEGASDERRAIAILAMLDAWPRSASGRCETHDLVSRAELYESLYRILVALDFDFLTPGVVVGLSTEGPLIVRHAGRTVEVPRSPGAAYLGESGGDLVAFGGGEIFPGDTIGYALRDGALTALVVRGATSGGDDRRARDARWTVTVPRSQIEARIPKAGTINELRVLARGVSGRVTELVVRGDRGEVRLAGYAVKTTLGLKDDRVVIEPVPGPAGAPPAAFRFVGRGWGHGVGLCQEGAYGMALRGATYDQILGRYFAGAMISSLASLDSIGSGSASR